MSFKVGDLVEITPEANHPDREYGPFVVDHVDGRVAVCKSTDPEASGGFDKGYFYFFTHVLQLAVRQKPKMEMDNV